MRAHYDICPFLHIGVLKLLPKYLMTFVHRFVNTKKCRYISSSEIEVDIVVKRFSLAFNIVLSLNDHSLTL